MTVLKMEGLAARQPLPLTHIDEVYDGRPKLATHCRTIVPTRLLAPVIERLIAETANAPKRGEQLDPLSQFLHRIIHQFPDTKAQSLARRVHRVRHGEYPTMKADIAERLLIGADTSLREQEMLELPASIAAARERIDIYCELRGREMPVDVKCDLADDLFEFALLVVFGPAEEWAVDEAAAA